MSPTLVATIFLLQAMTSLIAFDIPSYIVIITT